MSSSIDIYPIDFDCKTILKQHGLNTNLDVLCYSKEKLIQMTSLKETEIEKIFNILKGADSMNIVTKDALTLLECTLSEIPIPTLSSCIDEILEGGFHTGRLYQLYGEPGSGKTQLCLQLCCNVQIPKLVGNNHSSAIYIDSANTFKSERFIQIAMALIERVEPSISSTERNLTIENMKENLFIFKCDEPQKLNGLIKYELENVIKEKSPKLIILDSIASQFRNGFDEFVYYKHRILLQLGQKLKYLASKYDLCVVCINQISFDLSNQKIVPCLGFYWNSAPFANIRFTRMHSNVRSVQGEKGCSNRDRAFFKIEATGICDLDDSNNLDQLNYQANEKEEELEMIFTQEAELLNNFC